MSKVSIIREYLTYIKVRKKWILIPLVIFLLLVAAVIIFTHSSAVHPIIYFIF